MLRDDSADELLKLELAEATLSGRPLGVATSSAWKRKSAAVSAPASPAARPNPAPNQPNPAFRYSPEAPDRQSARSPSPKELGLEALESF